MRYARRRKMVCLLLMALFVVSFFPASAAKADKATVETVEHPGTRINLFDYWITGQDAPDTVTIDSDTIKQGINGPIGGEFGELAQLKFSRWINAAGFDAEDGKIPANIWTGSQQYIEAGGLNVGGTAVNKLYPCGGIVQSVLKNNYPATSTADSSHTGITKEQSLAYLFDPSYETEGKESYTNVSGLLRQDPDGYYYYDCYENFAEFNKAENRFTLYAGPLVPVANDTAKKGQFFPFNTYDEVQNKNYDDNDKTFHHYFGLTMTTRFIQLRDGKAYNNKNDVIYHFSGDDDVWIFIDDVLVADIGGIHDPVSLDINFATGKVTIYKGTSDEAATVTTLYEQFQKAGRESAEEWRGDTFANDTVHTLKFFYLERGNGQSNLSLKFNLVEVPETFITKTDQLGNPVAGAKFELYAADDEYTIPAGSSPVCTGLTNAAGKMPLTNDEGDPLGLSELAAISGHFVLRETGVPEGARSEVPDIRLYIYQGANNAKLLLVDDAWESGAYAIPSMTVRATNEIFQWQEGNQKGKEISAQEIENGKIFAVAFYHNGEGDVSDERNWYPISGDIQNGWNIHQSSGWDDILTAAKETPNIFTVLGDGALGCAINEIPGTVQNYYYLLAEGDKARAKYTYAFYFTEGDIENATEENTVRIYGDDFIRVFSAHIYVPNMVNTLYVKKTDALGRTLNGAGFSLYRAEDVAVSADGSVTIPQNVTPYDSAVTGINLEKTEGYAAFPSNYGGWNPEGGGRTVLEQGEYYLIEEKAPEGYLVNSYAARGIRVVVDDSGVFVDAGTAEDGVAVRKQAGRIVKSMEQFATADALNRTLHNIKAISQISQSYPFSDWNGNWDEEGNTELHLVYNAEGYLEYVPETTKSGMISPIYLETDTGYIRLRIRQCMEHGLESAAYKEALGNMDLTHLFSVVTTVIVTDEPDVSGKTVLQIAKRVVGGDEDKRREFSFSVSLTDQSVSGTYWGMTFENGISAFTLRDGESKTAIGLPEGIGYQVTEEADGAFETVMYNETGVLEGDKPAQVLFVNTRLAPTSNTGGLKVSKRVVGGDEDKRREFSFSVSLTDQSISGTYGDMTFENGISAFTLRDGESKTAVGLPEGIGYRVAEEADDDFWADTQNETGVVKTGEIIEALFINTRFSTPPKTGDPIALRLLFMTAAGIGLAGAAFYAAKKRDTGV